MAFGYEFAEDVIPNGTITVTNKAAMAVNNIGTPETITYDGTTYDVSAMFTKDVNAGDASYEIVTGGTGNGIISGSTLTITKAGTINIRMITAAIGNYAEGYATATLTVNKGTVDVPAAPASKTYTGNAQTSGMEDTERYTVSEISNMVDARNYNVTLTLEQPDLWKWSTTDEETVIVDFEITKAENSWTTVPDITGWTYGAESNSPIGAAKFGTVDFSYNRDPVNAGSYTMTAMIAETDNYEGLTIDVPFVIAKASSPTVNIDKQSFVSTIATIGNTVDIAAKLPTDRGETTYAILNMPYTPGMIPENGASISSDGILTFDTLVSDMPKNDIITLQVTMTNYSNATVEIIIELFEEIPVNNTGVDKEITYSEETYDVTQLFIIDENAGTASYSIVGGSGAGTLNGSVLTITKAGTIEIKLNTAASGDYAAGEATAIMTVKKGTGSGTVTINNWTYGDTAKAPVSDSTTNGTANVTYKYTGEGYDSTDAPVNAGKFCCSVFSVQEITAIKAYCLFNEL